jgi:hypothetical protein
MFIDFDSSKNQQIKEQEKQKWVWSVYIVKEC